ncbi:sugar phosphate isomerase/epimerase family protein [Anatilimnocola floriformis]|uniref:sugar phosphate isomerase/epimerase family protein n=1 Tax=Anatilimnocola floriformis TaxID=2948575 RepID=UPI0020C2D864|nr:sugar phosphate isomerase/epimerase family protein [Anatilimnocola floriformis]
MLQIKVAIELASLKARGGSPQLSFAQALHTAARLGAEAVEIDGRNEVSVADLSRTGVRQVRKMLEDLNLRVSALSFRTRRGYADVNELDRRIDATKRALQLAYELGTNVVVNHIGRIPTEEDANGLSTLRTALADIGREGHRVGALLAAETGTESGADLLKLIDSLPPGSLGVDFNPANLITHGFDPREAAQKLGAHVLHVHATDGTRDVAAGRGIEVPLGRGSAEFPEILGALEEHQYRGYLTIRRTESSNPLEEIAAAVKYLRAL